MFRSRPENFTFDGLEDGDRNAFRLSRRRMTTIWPDLPSARPMLAVLCGHLLVWVPPVHAAACALACKARKRIMLRATANHSRWMRALILPRSGSWRRPMRRAWALMHSCSARSR
jgi:hypothetical protein